MTRKDYILIAEVLRVEYYNSRIRQKGLHCSDGERLFADGQCSAVWLAANSMADSLARDNSRFNREHFLDVVRGDKPLLSRPSRNGVQS